MAKMVSITAIKLLFLNSAHSFTLYKLVLTPLLIFQAEFILFLKTKTKINQKLCFFCQKLLKWQKRCV